MRKIRILSLFNGHFGCESPFLLVNKGKTPLHLQATLRDIVRKAPKKILEYVITCFYSEQLEHVITLNHEMLEI